jgi:crossover junction endodeoxyribonuclease RusA
MAVFKLPFPPSLNHYWRRVGCRTLISREGRRFRDRVTAILAAENARPIAGWLSVWIDFYPPDNRRRDIDNLPKAVLDALQHGGAYMDDSQIVRLHLEKRDPVPGGLAVVHIEAARS